MASTGWVPPLTVRSPSPIGSPAGRADRLRVELGAAGVLEDHGLGARVEVAVAPLLELQQHRVQLVAGLGQQVLVARRALGVEPALDDARLLELAQPAREHVARGAGAVEELGEARAAVADLAHDQQRVALADEREGIGDRADPWHWLIACSPVGLISKLSTGRQYELGDDRPHPRLLGDAPELGAVGRALRAGRSPRDRAGLSRASRSRSRRSTPTPRRSRP